MNHEAKRDEMSANRSLKLGILPRGQFLSCNGFETLGTYLSAIIQAMIHKVSVIRAQLPVARSVRLPMCLVPRNMRT